MDCTLDFNRSPNALRSLDGQSGKLRRNDLRRVQDRRVLRATHALAEIGQVVADDQNLAACRQGQAGIPQHSRSLIGRDLEVRDERELVGVGGWLVVEQVRQHPIDGNVAPRRELPSLVQAHGREVHRSDPPAPLSQPDCVSTFAAGEIESPPGWQATELMDHEPVRLHGPEELAVCVSAIPLIAAHDQSPLRLLAHDGTE